MVRLIFRDTTANMLELEWLGLASFFPSPAQSELSLEANRYTTVDPASFSKIQYLGTFDYSTPAALNASPVTGLILRSSDDTVLLEVYGLATTYGAANLSIAALGDLLGADDVIYGAGMADVLYGQDGNDVLSGQDGADVAVFRGAVAEYTIGVRGGAIIVTDTQPGTNGDDGTDMLFGIENLQFADLTLHPFFGEPEVHVTPQNELHFSPSVDTFSDGGFILAWQVGSSGGVVAQRFDANADPVGNRIAVAANGGGSAQVAVLENGGFVVGWFEAIGSSHEVFARLYDSAGDPLGNPFQVNLGTVGNQYPDAISALADGGFVAVWTSSSQDGYDAEVYARRYDADGNALGPESRVNVYTNSWQQLASATPLADGGFVVVWESMNQDGNWWGVYGRRYDSDGNAGTEFLVNTTTAGGQWQPDVASLVGGGFIVTWSSSDGDQDGIYAQRYNAAGTPIGGEFLVNTNTAGNQENPEVTGLGDGGFVIIWELQDPGVPFALTGTGEVWGQRFDASSASVGSEFRVNAGPAVSSHDVAALIGGGFVVTWDSWEAYGGNNPPPESGVFTQRFDADGNLPGALILNGTAVADTIRGGEGRQVIYGFDGNDSLTGGEGTDTLEGGAGNDSLDGGTAADFLRGGLGDDTYVVNDTGDVVSENAAEGTDTVQTGLASYALGANVENLAFTTSGAHTGTGNALANMLTGDAGNDTFFAGDGADTVVGGDGADVLVGHESIFDTVADILDGGAGDDILYGEASDFFQGGSGRDLLYIVNSNAVAINLGTTNIEWIQTDFGNDVIDGSTQTVGIEVYSDGGNDIITGSSHNDIIWSGSGDDWVAGGAGDDVIVADIGVDTVTGGEGNDSLYGDSGDLFDGDAGFDALYITGGAGISIDFAVTQLEWVADFVGGDDALDGANASVALEAYAAGGSDTVTGGWGVDFLWGGAGDDAVSGNAGDDTLVGEAGADTLTGGSGIDALYGNSGNGGDGAVDTFVFTDGWGTDFVFDFENGVDKLDMSAVTGLNSFADLMVTDTPDGHAYVTLGSDLIAVANASGMIDAGDFLF